VPARMGSLGAARDQHAVVAKGATQLRVGGEAVRRVRAAFEGGGQAARVSPKLLRLLSG